MERGAAMGEDSPASAAVILTKTQVPPYQRGVIERRELLGSLAEASDHPLIVVRAPAGYGKSTLLAQWARTDDSRRFAWVSLDRSDNDAVVFWRYVLGALRQCEPGLAEDAWMRLQAPSPPLTGIVIPGLLNALLELRQPMTLILDDYHRITSDRIRETMELFLDYLPRIIQVVLATRAAPSLNLARYRARRLVYELRRVHLAFTPDETAQALVQLQPSIGADEIEAVHRTSEGWATGVYLAGVSSGVTRDGQSGVSGRRQPIREYVIREMLDELDDQDRVFLRRTSILDQLSGELCDHVLDTNGSGRRLSALADANLLLIPLDDIGTQYRFHHLLQGVLQADLALEEPETVAVLNRRAFEWFLERERPAEAVHYALAAGERRLAAELVCAQAYLVATMGHVETVQRWLDHFADSEMAAYPPLYVAGGWAAAFGGDAEAGRHYVALAEAASFVGPSPDGMASYSSSAALLAGALALDGVAKAAKNMTIAFDSEPVDSPWRVPVAMIYGVAIGASGDLNAARIALEESVDKASVEDGSKVYGLAQLAFVAACQGEWDEASELVRRSIEITEAHNLEEMPTSDGAYAIAAWIAVRRGDSIASMQYMRRMAALEHTLAASMPFEALQAHVLAAEVQLSLDDVAAAAVHARAADRYLRVMRDGGVLADRLDAILASLGDAYSASPDAASARSGELTVRERQILSLLQTDLSLREIGNELYVSRNTAKTHASRVYRKLGVGSRSAAVARARELGLL